MKIRIFYADDHAIVREGIARLLAAQPDMEIAGTAGDGAEAVEKLKTAPCDVLLLDLSLPKLPGVEVLREVKKTLPKVRVLILSMHAEDQYAVHLLRAGAAGYVSKGCSPDQLLTAIRKVARGERYISNATVEQLLRIGGKKEILPHEELSGREMEVFFLLTEGASPTVIAERLKLSGSTVSTYVARIKSKLGLKTLGEIVAYAHRHSIVRRTAG